MSQDFERALAGEALGTFFLLATVVGSGIMAETLAGGNVAIALLANAIATGAILYVLIVIFGPVSGAHFNPAVTLSFLIKGEITGSRALCYVGTQIIAGIAGVVAAHAMFDQSLLQLSAQSRTGGAQWFSEFIATFGLVATILGALRARRAAVPMAVGLYITSAYWFTASTSFANPAVTIARSLTATFSGIEMGDVGMFLLAQCAGAIAATFVMNWLLRANETKMDAATEPL